MVVFLLLVLWGCSNNGIYRAYQGEIQNESQLAIVSGAKFLRLDWLNRYVDAVRFLQVDDQTIDNAEAYDSIEIEPGLHDFWVYFSWDLGNERGLAPALVDYAESRPTISRHLSFNVEAGNTYTVQAEAVFNSDREDITELSHVDYWVVDQRGTLVVSREEGRYVP